MKQPDNAGGDTARVAPATGADPAGKSILMTTGSGGFGG
jgi:hypothetical protein